MSLAFSSVSKRTPLFANVFKRYASTRQRQQADVFQPTLENDLAKAKAEQQKTGIPSFMKKYSSYDLMCYTALCFVTSQPWLLKLATKALPYTPTPLVKSFVCPIYCGGENFDEVRATARKLLDRGVGNMMLSYAVEDADGTLGAESFDASIKQIKASITEILLKHNKVSEAAYAAGEVAAPAASGYIALKPTGLMEGSADILANYNNPAYAEKYEKYLDVCRSICQYAKDNGEGKVVIVFDAEKDWLQKGVYDTQRRMMKEFNHNGEVITAGTVQMYLQGSYDFLKNEIATAKKEGYQVAMKLVRGAYTHSEPDRWNVIHKTKADTDASYNAGTNLMLDNIVESWKTGDRNGLVSRLIVASHNFDSCNMIAQRVEKEAPAEYDYLRNEDIVYGQLMGMNDDQSSDLSDRGHKVVKYVPWGPAKETKDYLTRRLEENGDAARGGWEHFVGGVRELSKRMFSRS